MADFNLNIYTPNGVVIKGLDCSSLKIPTVRGEINVLPGHTHILTEVDTGVLTATTTSGDRHFSMTSGLLKVLGDEITVLSTTSERAEDVDLERAESARSKAESRLSGKESLTSVEMIKFQRKLERARARITVGNLRQK